MTGLILKVRLQLGEQSVLRSGIRPVFWSLDVKDAKGINKTDAAALAGRFGLACPVYQIMHLSCPLCLAQRNWRICRSLAGVTKANQEGHRLGRQTIARI